MKASFVTGSRWWPLTAPDRHPIHDALLGTELLIVGDCRTGVDAIALDWALANDCIVRVYCASLARFEALRVTPGIHVELAVALELARAWDTRKGKVAGPIRNRRMAHEAKRVEAETGCKVDCYAFPLSGSRGTHDCIRAMREAGFTPNVYKHGD